MTVAAENLAPTCPLCGADANRHVGRKEHGSSGRSFRLEVRRCRVCELAFLAERPVGFDDELYAYYAGRLGRPREELYDPITTRRYEALLRRFEEHVAGRRVLDVGCGQGHFVDTASERGWAAHGIDLAEPAIAICESLGVSARKLDFFAPELVPSSFDVVTMFEIVEHVPDPVAFLRRAAELTRPGGLVYVTTPNFDGLDRRVLGMAWEPIHVEHLTYFDPTTLRRLVSAAAGLEILELHTHNVSARTLHALTWPIQVWRPRPSPSGPSPTGDEQLRARVEGSPILRLAKAALNEALDRTRLGSAMTVLCRRSS